MMMCGSLSELDLTLLVDGLDEHAPEVASTIAAYGAWQTIPREDVVSEEVQNFFARRLALDWDRLNPAR
jgi:hypothetical protein